MTDQHLYVLIIFLGSIYLFLPHKVRNYSLLFFPLPTSFNPATLPNAACRLLKVYPELIPPPSSLYRGGFLRVGS